MYYHDDYFRFQLRLNKKSDQHNILVRLAKCDLTNRVYYVAPCFYKCTDYNNYYLQKSILQHSVFIDCATLKEFNDGKPHIVSYRADGTGVQLKSRPIKVKDANEYPWEERLDTYENGNMFIERIGELLDRNFESVREIQEYCLINGIILQLWERCEPL